jgi:hypothetical protein
VIYINLYILMLTFLGSAQADDLLATIEFRYDSHVTGSHQQCFTRHEDEIAACHRIGVGCQYGNDPIRCHVLPYGHRASGVVSGPATTLRFDGAPFVHSLTQAQPLESYVGAQLWAEVSSVSANQQNFNYDASLWMQSMVPGRGVPVLEMGIQMLGQITTPRQMGPAQRGSMNMGESWLIEIRGASLSESSGLCRIQSDSSRSVAVCEPGATVSINHTLQVRSVGAPFVNHQIIGSVVAIGPRACAVVGVPSLLNLAQTYDNLGGLFCSVVANDEGARAELPGRPSGLAQLLSAARWHYAKHQAPRLLALLEQSQARLRSKVDEELQTLASLRLVDRVRMCLAHKIWNFLSGATSPSAHCGSVHGLL